MCCEVAVAEPEEATGEKFEYQAEVSRLMDLIVLLINDFLEEEFVNQEWLAI